MKLSLLSALILSLLISCLSNAGAITYQMVDLGTMGAKSATASFINDSGQIAGVIHGNNTVYEIGDDGLFFWDKGEVTYLEPVFSESRPYAINNKGQIIGRILYEDKATYRAAIWEKGKRTDIFDYDSEARGINDQGQVVGYRYTPYPYIDSGAFLWENDKASYVGKGIAYDINNQGHIILTSKLLKDGSAIDLAYPKAQATTAEYINDLDQIIGEYYMSSKGYAGFLWDNGVFTDLASYFSVDWAQVRGINNSGQMIGKAKVNSKYFYFVSQGNVLTELPGNLYGINNNGQVVGDLVFPDGVGHAVRWDPVVPEPASLIAILSGISSFGALSLLRRKVS